LRYLISARIRFRSNTNSSIYIMAMPTRHATQKLKES
jgi:hypothetical protein